jgi:hypothetical protein
MISLREAVRDKRVAAALAGLAVLLVAFRVYTARSGKPAEVPDASGPSAAGPSAVPKAQEAKSGPLPDRSAAAAETGWSWGRNPFLHRWKEIPAGSTVLPGSPENGGLAVLRGEADLPSGLRGTVLSGKSGIAVFGNRLVPAGDRIGGWTVERVTPYSVTLRSGKETRVVELFKPPPAGGKGRGGER